jgi:DNA-directed RNA polymerase alpha subunit
MLVLQEFVTLPVDAKAALFGPAPELPDDTLVDQVDLPQRIGRVLQSHGLKTVGEVRETSDEVLMSFPDLGAGSVKFLREALGLPSEDGVRCVVSKAPPVAR